MDAQNLKGLLEKVRDGALTIDDAVAALRRLPFENLGYATVDRHRSIRAGSPEVIFGKGKTPQEVAGIATTLLADHPNVLATRTSVEAFELLKRDFPEAEFFPRSGALRVWRDHTIHGKGLIVIVTAGTTDMPVAEEALVTAEIMGNEIIHVHDVGIAGIHRLFAHLETFQKAHVVVACAGMEASLPTVVGGLVSCPVIGVPTSVGYGAHFNGLASLLSMLNSCASNVTVVNIDNGFGGGYVASLINRL